MVVDFKLLNGSQQRLEAEPKTLANSQSVDAKLINESPKPEREDKDENERFIDNGDGTVTDAHTGRMWMRCALGQSCKGNTCHGESTLFTWGTATALSPSFADYQDWRLPTVDEFAEVFGDNSDRAESKTSFPWRIYEIAKGDHAPAFWSSSAWRNDPGFAVSAYDPVRNDIIYCETEYLDNPLQVLLVRSIEDTAHAVGDANISPSTTSDVEAVQKIWKDSGLKTARDKYLSHNDLARSLKEEHTLNIPLEPADIAVLGTLVDHLRKLRKCANLKLTNTAYIDQHLDAKVRYELDVMDKLLVGGEQFFKLLPDHEQA